MPFVIVGAVLLFVYLASRQQVVTTPVVKPPPPKAPVDNTGADIVAGLKTGLGIITSTGVVPAVSGLIGGGAKAAQTVVSGTAEDAGASAAEDSVINEGAVAILGIFAVYFVLSIVTQILSGLNEANKNFQQKVGQLTNIERILRVCNDMEMDMLAGSLPWATHKSPGYLNEKHIDYRIDSVRNRNWDMVWAGDNLVTEGYQRIIFLNPNQTGNSDTSTQAENIALRTALARAAYLVRLSRYSWWVYARVTRVLVNSFLNHLHNTNTAVDYGDGNNVVDVISWGTLTNQNFTWWNATGKFDVRRILFNAPPGAANAVMGQNPWPMEWDAGINDYTGYGQDADTWWQDKAVGDWTGVMPTIEVEPIARAFAGNVARNGLIELIQLTQQDPDFDLGRAFSDSMSAYTDRFLTWLPNEDVLRTALPSALQSTGHYLVRTGPTTFDLPGAFWGLKKTVHVDLALVRQQYNPNTNPTGGMTEN